MVRHAERMHTGPAGGSCRAIAARPSARAGLHGRHPAGVITAPVDPRDIRWEVDLPIYRVYFWHRPAAEPGVGQELMGWSSDEWRLTNAADVHEVLVWANGPAGRGRVFELYVEASHSDGLALLRLAGSTSDAQRR
jgi:hypothetical protein